MSPSCYIVCGSKPWNRAVFDRQIRTLPGNWHFFGKREELAPEAVAALRPKALFFLHWSWKVPREITEKYQCINFHMTDVPFGRGGSPLQNLILRSHRSTRLSALRMTDAMDAGPVYLKEDLSLRGPAREILERSSALAAAMIARIVREQPSPIPQEGTVVTFERRTPAQSVIPSGLTLPQLYDFIRMLDCEGYPPAFLEHGGYRYEFTNAAGGKGSLEARVRIRPAKEDRKG